MNPIDVGDQLKSYNPGLRPIRRGGWQALFYWLLNIVLVNSYLLSFHSNVEKSLKFNDQAKFREALIEALFEAAKARPIQRKQANIGTNFDGFTTPAHRHKMEHRGIQGECWNYNGKKHGEHPRKRVALSAISVNLSTNTLKNTSTTHRKRSYYGCHECSVPLCKERPCFEEYHLIQ